MQANIRKISAAPMIKTKKNVAAYARVSTGKDAMLHSLSAQVSYYSELIQRRCDWHYVGVYSDEALTGTKENRNGFQRMLADCRTGKIDMIITKSISRFARNTVTLLQTIRELKNKGIDVYFEEQNIHTLSADGEFMLTILASYAQEESLSASENQKWRIRKGFENGELMNLRFMFGYKINRGEITVDPNTAPIVKEIFERVINDESYDAIARDLNERGISTFYGYQWVGNLIKAIIRNEKYTGNALLQKSYINNHLEKKQLSNTGELPRYYAEGTHTGIIDKDTFERAKAVAERRKEQYAYRAPRSFSVFSGLIKCPKCGKSYRKISRRGYDAYNCSTFINRGKAYCHGKTIPESVLIKETTAVLGLAEFDENAVKKQIAKIVVPEPNHLLFVLNNGETVERVWKDRSRSESWTQEMREAARQRKWKGLIDNAKGNNDTGN